MVAVTPKPTLEGTLGTLRRYALQMTQMELAGRQAVREKALQLSARLRSGLQGMGGPLIVDRFDQQLGAACDGETAADRATAAIHCLTALDGIRGAVTAEVLAKIIGIVGLENVAYQRGGEAE